MIHLYFLMFTRSSNQVICVTNFLNHFIRSRVFWLQGVTYNRKLSPGSKHLDFVFCRTILSFCFGTPEDLF